MSDKIRNVVVISDTHCGCQFGLCIPGKFKLDGGGVYMPSKNQKKVYKWWREFWNEWIPEVTKNQPFILVHNGDAIDGRHHNSTTQISQNIADQVNLAYELLAPVVKKSAQYYHIRGTEAHIGQSGEFEEILAQQLGAIPNEDGNYARWELWLKLNHALIHFAHHIGTTGRTHYETSAVMAELAEMYAEAGRWKEHSPDVVVRSHRHRNIEIRVPSALGYNISMVTAGWQLRTPFTYKIAGGRIATPQLGGSIIRTGNFDEIYARHYTKNIGRTREVIV